VSGQIRPPRDVRGMSVISPKAAVMRTSSFGRFVPIAAICAAAIPSLFDNLVGDSIKNSDRRMLRHSTEQQRGERTYPCRQREFFHPFPDAADLKPQARARWHRDAALDHRTEPHPLLVDTGV